MLGSAQVTTGLPVEHANNFPPVPSSTPALLQNSAHKDNSPGFVAGEPLALLNTRLTGFG